jgi:hypothetical protein
VFTFLSLALIKRCSELIALGNNGQASVPVLATMIAAHDVNGSSSATEQAVPRFH